MTATEHLSLVVPPEHAGKRLDVALAALCAEHSRSRLQEWIRAGQVTVNGNKARPRDAVNPGDRIEIDAMHERAIPETHAEYMPLDIVHEDEEILILNKPPGLVVHPGAGNPGGTLMNALLHHAPQLERVPRAGIVHRLDKGTSGLIAIARTPSAHTFLVERMKRREVLREYEALVHGAMTSGGDVTAPIGRHPHERKRMAINDRGRAAITHFRLIRRYPAFTHLRVTLETGRTHQIRVHMAHIRHPVVGDPMYGGRNRVPRGVSESLRQLITGFPRQALHAARLALEHPASRKKMEWQTPAPADLRALISAIERET